MHPRQPPAGAATGAMTRGYAGLLLAAAVVATLAGSGIGARAGWSARGNSAALTARSARIPVPDRPRADLSGGTPTIAWHAVRVTPGEPVDRYVVIRVHGATREVACTVAAPATSCVDDGAARTGAVRYLVHARLGARWVGGNSAPSEALVLAARPAPGATPSAPTAAGPAPGAKPSAPTAARPTAARPTAARPTATTPSGADSAADEPIGASEPSPTPTSTPSAGPPPSAGPSPSAGSLPSAGSPPSAGRG